VTEALYGLFDFQSKTLVLNPRMLSSRASTLKRKYSTSNSLYTVFHEIGHAASEQVGFRLPLDEMMRARMALENPLTPFATEDNPLIDRFLQHIGQAEKHADSFAEAALGVDARSSVRGISPYTTIGEKLDSPIFRRNAHPAELVRVGRVRPDLRLGVGGYINVGTHHRDLESLVRPKR